MVFFGRQSYQSKSIVYKYNLININGELKHVPVNQDLLECKVCKQHECCQNKVALVTIDVSYATAINVVT